MLARSEVHEPQLEPVLAVAFDDCMAWFAAVMRHEQEKARLEHAVIVAGASSL
jgi:hypothetical protein